MKTTYMWLSRIWVYAMALLSGTLVLGGVAGMSFVENLLGKNFTARLQIYAEEIFILILVGLSIHLYVRSTCYLIRDKLTNQQWFKDHQRLVALTLSWPFMIVMIPIFEEVIFRLPLLLWLPGNHSLTWIPIVISASLFAAIHLFNRPFHQVVIESTLGTSGRDRDEARLKKRVSVSLVAQVLVTFVFGLTVGWLGIEYQSLWFCVKCHFALNLWSLIFGPIVMFVLVLCFVLAVQLFPIRRS